MNQLLDICSEIKDGLQEISKSLAKIIEKQTADTKNEWYRKEQVLKLMRISPRTFDRLIHTGKLPYSKINGLIYINSTDLSQYLHDNNIKNYDII